MSDSLKDQLLKAGFKETDSGKKPAKRKNKTKRRGSPNQSSSSPAKKATAAKPKEDDAAAIAERKRIKASIKELIEAEEIKKHQGEIAFGYVLGKKVRQLFVNPEAHKRLSSGECVITRLNGNTRIIPATLVPKILELNPGWAIVSNQSDESKSSEDDEYGDYQVPDDLTW